MSVWRYSSARQLAVFSASPSTLALRHSAMAARSSPSADPSWPNAGEAHIANTRNRWNRADFIHPPDRRGQTIERQCRVKWGAAQVTINSRSDPIVNIPRETGCPWRCGEGVPRNRASVYYGLSFTPDLNHDRRVLDRKFHAFD